MSSRIINKLAQAKLLGYWLMYLSIPALFVGLSKIPIKTPDQSTQGPTNRAQVGFLLILLFGLVPFMMAWFSTRPSIYVTKTSTILGLVGLYLLSWLMSSLIYPKPTAAAINPNENAWKLAAIHAACCGVVVVGSILYVLLTNNDIVNSSKIKGYGGGNVGGGYGGYNRMY